MMHLRISKKIFIYLFLFLILVSINNINFKKFDILSIVSLKVSGLNDLEKIEFEEEFNYLISKNLLFLDKSVISKKIFSNKIVEDLSIFKKYPSELEIIIKKTNFLAVTKKDNKNYFIGSNGNFILVRENLENLPFIFGDIEPRDFLKLKDIIERSNFDMKKIKNLYFFKSKRWDIETIDNLIVKLPIKKVEQSLNLLTKILNEEEFQNKKLIDLRHSNQVITND